MKKREKGCRNPSPPKISSSNDLTNILLDKLNIGPGKDQIYDTFQGPQISLESGDYVSSKFDDSMDRLKKHDETVNLKSF